MLLSNVVWLSHNISVNSRFVTVRPFFSMSSSSMQNSLLRSSSVFSPRFTVLLSMSNTRSLYLILIFGVMVFGRAIDLIRRASSFGFVDCGRMHEL